MATSYAVACELTFHAGSWLCYGVFQTQFSGWLVIIEPVEEINELLGLRA